MLLLLKVLDLVAVALLLLSHCCCRCSSSSLKLWCTVIWISFIISIIFYPSLPLAFLWCLRALFLLIRSLLKMKIFHSISNLMPKHEISCSNEKKWEFEFWLQKKVFYSIKWTPLNVIMVNVISLFLWSHFICPISYGLVFKNYRLLSTVGYVVKIVIHITLLSSFHCNKFIKDWISPSWQFIL